jgi:hypothetical protein
VLKAFGRRRHGVFERQQAISGVSTEPGVGITHRRGGDTTRCVTGREGSLQIVMQPESEFLD